MASSMSGGKGNIPGYQQGSMSTLSPQQQQLYSQMLQGSQGGIGAGLQHMSRLAGGDESYFQQLEAPAMRQFGALQGNMASRFSGMGTGARRSSGFGNASSSAAQQLTESLQAQRMGLQQGAIDSLLGIGRDLLGTQTQENYLMPNQMSGFQQFMLSLGGGIGQGLGTAGGMYAGSKIR